MTKGTLWAATMTEDERPPHDHSTENCLACLLALQDDLDELERTNPTVAAAVERYEQGVRKLIRHSEVVAERDRLRAVIAKMAFTAGLAIEGPNDEFLSYAHDEYAKRHHFTPDELAAYRTAIGRDEP